MSIWGKIVGGAAGFALGGPLGALIGGLAGHAVDQHFGQRAAEAARTGHGEAAGEIDGTRQIAFTIGVIVLGAKMAKADGRVTGDEIAAFREVFHVPPEEVPNVGWVFDRARRESEGFEPYAAQIAALFRRKPAVLEDLMAALFHIARADGAIHEAEIDYLRRVAGIFGFDETAFARLRATHLGPDPDDPYVVLGAAHDASDEELKKLYRKLIKDNHPDKLIAAGMPQEFVDLANEKLARINAAYDRIQQQRQPQGRTSDRASGRA